MYLVRRVSEHRGFCSRGARGMFAGSIIVKLSHAQVYGEESDTEN